MAGVTAALTAVVGREIEALTLAEAAEHLDVPRTRISQMIKQGQLLGVREGDRWIVPKAFLVETGVVKGLPGLITVLRDGGYTDVEILRWLFLEDPTLLAVTAAPDGTDRVRAWTGPAVVAGLVATLGARRTATLAPVLATLVTTLVRTPSPGRGA